MSYNQHPPPPPDCAPAPQMGGPQPAGPGGVYGPVQGTPGPGMVAVPTQLEPERPEAKPGSVTLVQLLLWLVALSLLVWIPVLMAWEQADHLSWGDPTDRTPQLERFIFSDLGIAALYVLIGTTIFAVLAIISAVGLQRGRFWARVFSAIWAGLAVIGASNWIFPAWILAAESIDAPDSGGIVGLRINVLLAAGACLAFTASLWAFILLFRPGVRSWTPGTTTVLSHRQAGPGFAPPPGPSYGAPPPAAPLGYAPPQQQPPPHPPRY